MSVKFDNHGVKILYIGENDKVTELKGNALKVNPAMVKPMEALCEYIGTGGELYTYGIICNRTTRSGKSTSKHSEGTKASGYKKWQDGSHGSRAIDIRKWICGIDGTPNKVFTWVVTDKADRDYMIIKLQAMGFTVLHKGVKGDPKVTPDHLHCEVNS